MPRIVGVSKSGEIRSQFVKKYPHLPDGWFYIWRCAECSAEFSTDAERLLHEDAEHGAAALRHQKLSSEDIVGYLDYAFAPTKKAVMR